jgi:hypothetical protein
MGDGKSGRPPKPVDLRISKVAAPGGSVPPSGPPRRLVRTRSPVLAETTRRAPIRLLLRPNALGAVGPSFSGELVIPVGPATKETWGDAWRPDDEEALVWVPAPRVNEVLNELREDPRIVDVRVSMRDVR